ncbi:hypothetical protein Vretifemale_4068, partial [Volvox reticuliferus]
VAFSAGEGGGAGDTVGSVAAAAVRRRHAVARRSGSNPRRGGAAATPDDMSEDIRLSAGTCLESGRLLSAAPDVAAAAWMVTSPVSGEDSAAAARPSIGTEPANGSRTGLGRNPSRRLSRAPEPTAAATANAPLSSLFVVSGDTAAGTPSAECSPVSPHQPLLTRLGSKLMGRNVKRGSLVFPLIENERDSTELYGPYGPRSGELDGRSPPARQGSGAGVCRTGSGQDGLG